MRRHNTRQGSVYIAVTGVAMIVALIGFTSMHLSRLELRMSTSLQDDAYARVLAQSSVEMALAQIDQAGGNSWRTTFFSGTENSITPDSNFETLYFKFIDTDGNLSDDNTDPVEIQGIGRCGNSTFVYSVDYAPAITSSQQISPPIIQSYDGGTTTHELVGSGAFVGQHFIPALPVEAVSWSITHIEIYIESDGGTGSMLAVNFYNSDGGGEPSTLIESVSVPESSLPSTADWHIVNFATLTGLIPGQGYSVTVEYVSGGPAAKVPYGTGVSQTNSHLLRGGWGGWNTSASQSIQYRVHGSYTTGSGGGEFTITPGSWRRVTAP